MRQTVQTFEVETVQEHHMKDQYFIMYCTEEGESFNPANIFGVWSLSQAAHIVNRFRQTGVLLKPAMAPWLHSSRGDVRDFYTAIDDAISVYVLCPSDILYKKFTYVEMDREEAQAYTARMKEARKTIEEYQREPK